MKKKKVPRAVQAQQQAPKLNPFELKGSRKKFDVLGKRDKKEKNNVIKSREEAYNRRKKTLLVEYKQLRKANTFIDRRFGEDDPALGEEDKALARFQVQRIKEARRATRFALSGTDGEEQQGGGSRRGGNRQHTLTHGGISLEELEELNSRPAAALAELDDDMLEDLVSSYHFGGGQEGQQEEGGDGQRRTKTKKEVMEEIIAKSKAAKAEKAQQREADEEALEQLDTTFKSLVADREAGLAALVKPAGYEKGRKVKADNAADAEYDRAARELAFEAKGQAADAAFSKEQLEERESARLTALEAARLKRMKADAAADAAAAGGGDDDGDGDGDAAAAADLPKGGYAAKRARARIEAEREERRQKRKLDPSGDALEENYDLSEGDEDDSGSDGGSDSGSDGGAPAAANALEARRQAAAAGGHPLQASFREAAARLAAKHGVQVQQQQGDSDEEGESEEGSEGEGESGSEESESEGDHGEEGGAGAARGRKRARGDGEESEGGSGSEGGSSDEGDEGDSEDHGGSDDDAAAEAEAAEAPHPTKALKQQQRQQQQQPPGQAAAAAAAAAEFDGPLDLSFTPAVPGSYPEFAALVAGRPADQLGLAIARIRTFNAAALATDSKRKLQVLYGILVQHFALLAGQQPVPTAHLDVLTQVLVQLTPEVPFYAATVARTRLDKLHERLSAALADPLGAGGSLLGWPGSRQLLQLRLFALLFPTSDRRHPVTTPLALLVGKYLSQCPVNSGYTAALGLLLAGMALQNAAAAARFCPEAVNFVTATLQAFLPAVVEGPSTAAGAGGGGKQRTAAAAASACVSRFTPELLVLDCCKAAATTAAAAAGSKRSKKQQLQGKLQQQEQIAPIKLYQLLSSSPEDPQFSGDPFRLQLLCCAVSTAQRVLQLSRGCGAAAPEVLAPLAAAAEAVGRLQGLPAAAAAAVQGLAQGLSSRMQEVVGARQPMVQSHRVKVVVPREYNPRFEADFNAAADYDYDRQRSESKKLQRQLVKEKRGAMRELRRDASFMAAERDAEKSRVNAERLASERSFYAELQRQEADAKSGGQRGMNPHKKKKGRQ